MTDMLGVSFKFKPATFQALLDCRWWFGILALAWKLAGSCCLPIGLDIRRLDCVWSCCVFLAAVPWMEAGAG
jgi:hypothetical protein